MAEKKATAWWSARSTGPVVEQRRALRQTNRSQCRHAPRHRLSQSNPHRTPAPQHLLKYGVRQRRSSRGLWRRCTHVRQQKHNRVLLNNKLLVSHTHVLLHTGGAGGRQHRVPTTSQHSESRVCTHYIPFMLSAFSHARRDCDSDVSAVSKRLPSLTSSRTAVCSSYRELRFTRGFTLAAEMRRTCCW